MERKENLDVKGENGKKTRKEKGREGGEGKREMNSVRREGGR